MDSLHIIILSVLVLLGWNFIQNIKRMNGPKGFTIEAPLPSVSVLIPARNEEDTIEKCVSSLLKSDYPCLEIIVLDDDSTDQTFQIAKRLSLDNQNLRVVKGQDLPPGWNGKNWACHQLAQMACGEWFLFTDADTCHAPSSVSHALHVARKGRAEFVTAVPGLITKTWAEKLILPVIHFAFFVLLPYHLANFSKPSRVAVGIGPFLFIHKECYFSIGGFHSIKAEILDDMILARKVKKSKRRLSLIDGTGFMQVRFYSCFKEVWSGFSKNSFQAIGSSPPFLLGISVVCYFLFVFPYLSLGSALVENHSVTFPLFQVLAISSIKVILSFRCKTSLVYSLLHPLTILLTLLILFNSFRLQLLGKKMEWKERLYPVK